MTVVVDGGQAAVSGNACLRGEAYGRQEAIEPMRSLTTTLRTSHPGYPRLAVRGSGDVPLRRLLDAMRALDTVLVAPPVVCGQVVVYDLLGLGVDIIATSSLPMEGSDEA